MHDHELLQATYEYNYYHNTNLIAKKSNGGLTALLHVTNGGSYLQSD